MRVYVNADNKLVSVSNTLEIKVLDLLLKHKKPLRHKDLVVLIFKEYNDNNRTKVYKALKSLKEKNLIDTFKQDGVYIYPILKGEARPLYYTRKILYLIFIIVLLLNIYCIYSLIYDPLVYLINIIAYVVIMIAEFVEKKIVSS